MRPLLIYDGDCNFCVRWIKRWRLITGEDVDYAPYQEVGAHYPQIPEESFLASVQLVEEGQRVAGGAEAVFRVLACAPNRKWLLWLYRRVPGVKWVTESFYSLVAGNRILFSRLTLLFWGNNLDPPRHRITHGFFQSLLGLTYLVAFVSYWVQVDGLIGSQGILPAADFLNVIHERVGSERYALLPTLAWFSAEDTALHLMCAAGTLFSLFIFCGLFRVLSLTACWVLYLSLVTVGRDFLSFQWDTLLLEAGFLGIFSASLCLYSRFRNPVEPSGGMVALYRWLVFRLTFAAGIVKLSSGDGTWRKLLALNYHYETQPIPHWVSWYAHQLPEWFQRFCVAQVFIIELALPLLIFGPRRCRYLAFWGIVGFQVILIATGNYTFFNWLTIFLCLFVVDDSFWPQRIRNFFTPEAATHPSRTPLRWPRLISIPIIAIIVLISVMAVPRTFRKQIDWPPLFIQIRRAVAPFHLVSSYGLFAVMTTQRPEIIVEGSMNGVTWKPYEFKYKPGDLSLRPRWVAPHQPRLDWQMWFAALGSVRQNPWFINFCARLLQGSKPVLDLLADNPFGERAPRFVRATVYDYRFTDFEIRKRTGQWWQRDKPRVYLPPISLRDLQPGGSG
ncbi:MAG: lipase maturation factor family protein [Candidatus Omnitrophota bacterium]|nr:lipase maturation factor family protein [Candidatus Omnitrophota bacterium]